MDPGALRGVIPPTELHARLSRQSTGFPARWVRLFKYTCLNATRLGRIYVRPELSNRGDLARLTPSEGLEEGNQRLLIRRWEFQPKLVARHSPGLHTVAPEPGGNIVVPQPALIEPVLQCSHRAVVFKGAPVPHATQRRHFVITGAASCAKCESGIRFDRHVQDVVFVQVLLGNSEAAHGQKLVVGVVWRCVTDRAAFSLENLMPCLSHCV